MFIANLEIFHFSIWQWKPCGAFTNYDIYNVVKMLFFKSKWNDFIPSIPLLMDYVHYYEKCMVQVYCRRLLKWSKICIKYGPSKPGNHYYCKIKIWVKYGHNVIYWRKTKFKLFTGAYFLLDVVLSYLTKWKCSVFIRPYRLVTNNMIAHFHFNTWPIVPKNHSIRSSTKCRFSYF